ncbi:TRA2B [Cordylochernes scorpioides]|uniref:TRA2B n=1 Tax=Cordylochernes scorpioides TaxID=51811 RepID=A0ABY6LJT8_9ARAC|nr:TRA2B [Cordylochernes scorpioides]
MYEEEEVVKEIIKPSKCVGVFGLNKITDEGVLQEIFEEYGNIEKLELIKDAEGYSRCYAFIYYKDVESAKKAVLDSDGANIDGRHVRVDFSKTDGPRPPTPGVFLGRRPMGMMRPSRLHFPRRYEYYEDYHPPRHDYLPPYRHYRENYPRHYRHHYEDYLPRRRPHPYYARRIYYEY